MKLITKQKLIEGVPEAWRHQYETRPRGMEHGKRTIYEKLLDAKTEEEIDKAIGNKSWTFLECDECKQEVEAIVIVGDEPDYESKTAYLCLSCLQKAVELITEGE